MPGRLGKGNRRPTRTVREQKEFRGTWTWEKREKKGLWRGHGSERSWTKNERHAKATAGAEKKYADWSSRKPHNVETAQRIRG